MRSSPSTRIKKKSTQALRGLGTMQRIVAGKTHYYAVFSGFFAFLSILTTMSVLAAGAVLETAPLIIKRLSVESSHDSTIHLTRGGLYRIQPSAVKLPPLKSLQWRALPSTASSTLPFFEWRQTTLKISPLTMLEAKAVLELRLISSTVIPFSSIFAIGRERYIMDFLAYAPHLAIVVRAAVRP